MAAAAAGIIGGNGSSWIQLNQLRKKKIPNRVKFSCAAYSSSSSSSVVDPYKTLRIQPDASESEVKKAFRQLALQYHPDVCRGNNCGVQFHRINEAYDIVMSNLRGECTTQDMFDFEPSYQGGDEPMRGMDDSDWDMWEEWMGWEGAGIRDYTSHINPYI
ncbi:chaperone protein dnaJ 8, chloroplastic [Ziziphus jujuba]|uniref:Chaperone protein dnaJ 8, chloroplastic n=1 Tax=Ziziphus jujuba TaxID=326968 RepID=A0A6P3YY55_ZIZJJ|nr:chaperone protein dnaJ 8, chloroplastic [Ziziphus jujuba]XP_048331920.1 chaperone protein dnaJ 8, chloroplastic-like [Ziziphus jujuba var. spinosa]